MSFFARFTGPTTSTFFAVVVMTSLGCIAARAQAKTDTSKMPWMNKALSPDERADMVLGQMTLDEKIQMVHGTGWGVLRAGDPVPAKSNFAAGVHGGHRTTPAFPASILPTLPSVRAWRRIRLAMQHCCPPRLALHQAGIQTPHFSMAP